MDQAESTISKCCFRFHTWNEIYYQNLVFFCLRFGEIKIFREFLINICCYLMWLWCFFTASFFCADHVILTTRNSRERKLICSLIERERVSDFWHRGEKTRGSVNGLSSEFDKWTFRNQWLKPISDVNNINS